MSVTHGTGSGDESLVATPSNTTISTKAISSGANISLSSDANAVTITGANAPSDAPICIVTRSTNQTVTNSSSAVITYDTAVYNPNSMWEGVSNPERITIIEDGWYVCYINVIWTGHASSDGNVRSWITRANPSATTIANGVSLTKGVQNVTTQVYVVAEFSAGDYVTSTVNNASGQTLDVQAAGYAPKFIVQKVRST